MGAANGLPQLPEPSVARSSSRITHRAHEGARERPPSSSSSWVRNPRSDTATPSGVESERWMTPQWDGQRELGAMSRQSGRRRSHASGPEPRDDEGSERGRQPKLRTRGDESTWSSDETTDEEDGVLSIRHKPRRERQQSREPKSSGPAASTLGPPLSSASNASSAAQTPGNRPRVLTESSGISNPYTLQSGQTVTQSNQAEEPSMGQAGGRSQERLLPGPSNVREPAQAPPPNRQSTSSSNKARRSLEAVKKRFSGGGSSSVRTHDTTPRASRAETNGRPAASGEANARPVHRFALPSQPEEPPAQPDARARKASGRSSRRWSLVPGIFTTSAAPSPVPTARERERAVRRYTLHQGNNRFLFGGRLMTSRDSPIPFIVSLGLTVCIPVAFGVVEGPWIIRRGGGWPPVAVFIYSCSVMLSSMLVTAFRDPGVVPRGLDPSPETEWLDNASEALGGPGREVVKERWIQVRKGRTIPTKWCETCETYRPPRSSHCRICNNCVMEIDHHCTFLNTCIGRRNYFVFFAFLTSTVLNLLFVIGYSVALLIIHQSALGSSRFLLQPAREGIGSLVVGAVALLLLLPVGGLLGFHVSLIVGNRTTIERLRPKTTRRDLTLLHSLGSWHANCIGVICRPEDVGSSPSAFWKMAEAAPPRSSSEDWERVGSSAGGHPSISQPEALAVQGG